MKDINKMQQAMCDEGYRYCTRHDVYYDEALFCPACELMSTYIYLKDLNFYKEHLKHCVDTFNPEDRD